MQHTLKMKDPVSTLTHFIPLLAGIIGLGFLISMSKDNVPKTVTMTIFGVSVIALYLASSLYHWIITSAEKERFLRKLDHIAIYLLIAGSYTPVFYYGLHGTWRLAMLTAVWSLAIIGAILKLWFMKIPRFVSTAFYVALGWVALIPFVKLVQSLPLGAMILMASGGVAYTVGAIIYATKIFDFIPQKFGFHEIFHLFIAAGTIIHYIMMIVYIMPLSN